MAITLKTDGSISADTPEELAKFMAAREQQQQRQPEPQPLLTQLPKPEKVRPESTELITPGAPAKPVKPADLESAYIGFYDALADQPSQQRFLQLLLSSRQMVGEDEVRSGLQLSMDADFRGLLIGIIRRAKNRGLPPLTTKMVTRTDGGRKREYRYGVTPIFRRAMARRGEGRLLESA